MLDMRHTVTPDLDAAIVAFINAESPAAHVRQRAGDLPMFVTRAGLDVVDDDDRSRDIVSYAMAFAKTHLLKK